MLSTPPLILLRTYFNCWSLGRSIQGYSTSTKRCPAPAERASNVEPSIWVEYTKLAVDCNAVNLGQGFPDSPAPKFVTDILKELSTHPELTAAHQYTRGYGQPTLVNILARMYSDLYKTKVDPYEDVLVTVGAYLALYYAIMGWIDKGNEVMILEPAYDCYVPQVKMAGGVPVTVMLERAEDATTSADFKFSMESLEDKVSSKTKMLILNNPNNPIGKLFTLEELQILAQFAEKHDLIVVADEVYEWHVYDKPMIRFASLPGMYERTISIGSAGKAFSVTGWKLGWAIGPAQLLQPLKTIHQNCVFTCSTPTQLALAKAFEAEYQKFGKDEENSYLLNGLGDELRRKRDMLAVALKEAGFKVIMPDAGYFMLADFSNFLGENLMGTGPLDVQFAKWLCHEKKLAVIPPSAFCSEPKHKKEIENMIRVCFFKKDETLKAAFKILDDIRKSKFA